MQQHEQGKHRLHPQQLAAVLALAASLVSLHFTIAGRWPQGFSAAKAFGVTHQPITHLAAMLVTLSQAATDALQSAGQSELLADMRKAALHTAVLYAAEVSTLAAV